jgi:hypothetical protein
MPRSLVPIQSKANDGNHFQKITIDVNLYRQTHRDKARLGNPVDLLKKGTSHLQKIIIFTSATRYADLNNWPSNQVLFAM